MPMSRDRSCDGSCEAGEWPEATTPCAPLKHGDALIAYKINNKKKQRKQMKKEKKNDPKTSTAKNKENQMWVYVRDNQTKEKN